MLPSGTVVANAGGSGFSFPNGSYHVTEESYYDCTSRTAVHSTLFAQVFFDTLAWQALLAYEPPL